jgi:hypothetical protein
MRPGVRVAFRRVWRIGNTGRTCRADDLSLKSGAFLADTELRHQGTVGHSTVAVRAAKPGRRSGRESQPLPFRNAEDDRNERNRALPTASFAQAIYLLWLCRPSWERRLYRAVRRTRPRRIVELGFGDGSRASRIVLLARRYLPQETIHYAALDPFEARPSGPGVTLIQAHRRLTRLKMRARFFPGDTLLALAAHANDLTGTDLLIVDNTSGQRPLEQMSPYLRRMLHESSLIACHSGTEGGKRLMFLSTADLPEVRAWGSRRRLAA